MTDFLEACRTLTARGFTPVRTDANQRLRKWLDLNNYWPPADWEPIGEMALSATDVSDNATPAPSQDIGPEC